MQIPLFMINPSTSPLKPISPFATSALLLTFPDLRLACCFSTQFFFLWSSLQIYTPSNSICGKKWISLLFSRSALGYKEKIKMFKRGRKVENWNLANKTKQANNQSTIFQLFRFTFLCKDFHWRECIKGVKFHNLLHCEDPASWWLPQDLLVLSKLTPVLIPIMIITTKVMLPAWIWNITSISSSDGLISIPFTNSSLDKIIQTQSLERMLLNKGVKFNNLLHCEDLPVLSKPTPILTLCR